MKEFKLNSYDGYPIHVRIWEDAENPKGVVMLAHGMSEHGGRYASFAEFLNKNGYIVFADDHRAHGQTETDINRGKHDGDIFSKTVEDLVFFFNYLKEQYSLPVYLIGHSYGSFLSQAFLQRGTDVKAVILMGSAYMKSASFALPLLAPFQLVAKGWIPPFVNKASDKIFGSKYKGDSGASTWLTRDREQRQKFIEDPYSGQNLSINFDWNMLKAFSHIYSAKALSKLNPNTPVGIFSGDMDPIGGRKAKYAEKLADAYINAGVKDVEFKIYRGARHELLNEINKEEVYQDILEFLNKAN